MTNEQRIALARIVSDLIKADDIIEVDELRMLEEIKSQFNLKEEHFSQARQKTLTDAIKKLTEENLNRTEIKNIKDYLHSLTLSDGSCAPTEALIVLALDKIFEQKGKMISCVTNNSIGKHHFIVYLNGSDKADNVEDIENTSLRLREWGLDIVYIPRFRARVEQFAKEKDLINFLAPHCDVEDIQQQISNLTNQSFCNGILANTIGLNEVRGCEPSLLVYIGTSEIPNDKSITCYANYLLIKLKQTLKEEIKNFIDTFKEYVDDNTIQRIPPSRANRFRYVSFHKAIIDFLTSERGKESTIELDKRRHNITFLPCNKTVHLNPQEYAFYRIVLNERNGVIPTLEKITKYYDGNSEKTPRWAVLRSRIECKCRNEVGNVVSNLDDFIPKKQDRHYYLTALPDMITIKE